MGRVVHFEITADDPRRAAGFYQKVFGWQFSDYGGPFTYLLATTGEKDKPGIDGAIMDRSKDYPQAVINTIGVDDLDAAATAVNAAGGKVLQDKQAIPGVGWFSYCKDTEGNFFGIFKDDPKAK